MYMYKVIHVEKKLISQRSKNMLHVACIFNNCYKKSQIYIIMALFYEWKIIHETHDTV